MAIKKFEKLALSVSNKGIPCLWENGGKVNEEFGQSFIIADKYARPKRPLYIRTNPKANSGHALIPIRLYDIVVVCKIRNDAATIQIYSISKIDLKEKVAYVDMINSFEKGEWAAVPNNIYDNVINVAKVKAKTPNCVEAMYILKKAEEAEEKKTEEVEA